MNLFRSRITAGVVLCSIVLGTALAQPPGYDVPKSENEVASYLGSGSKEIYCILPTIRTQGISLALENALSRGASLYLHIIKSPSQRQNPYVSRLRKFPRVRITWSKRANTAICSIDDKILVASHFLGLDRMPQEYVIKDPVMVAALSVQFRALKTYGEVMK